MWFCSQSCVAVAVAVSSPIRSRRPDPNSNSKRDTDPACVGRWIRSFPRPRTPVGRGRRSLVALSGSGPGARQTCMLSKQASKQASSSSDVTVAATGSASCRVSARSDSEPAIDRSIYRSQRARNIPFDPSPPIDARRPCSTALPRRRAMMATGTCFTVSFALLTRGVANGRPEGRRCRVTGRSQPSSPAGPRRRRSRVSAVVSGRTTLSIDGLLLLHRWIMDESRSIGDRSNNSS